MSGGPRGECLHEDDFVEDMLERTIPVTLKDTAARIKSCREQLSPDAPILNCGVCCRSEILPMKFDPGRPAHQQLDRPPAHGARLVLTDLVGLF